MQLHTITYLNVRNEAIVQQSSSEDHTFYIFYIGDDWTLF
jgi:hypothetical protein